MALKKVWLKLHHAKMFSTEDNRDNNNNNAKNSTISKNTKKLNKKSSDDSMKYSASVHNSNNNTKSSPVRGGSHSLYIQNKIDSPQIHKKILENSNSSSGNYTSIRKTARTLSNSKNNNKSNLKQKSSNDSNKTSNNNGTIIYKLSFKLLCKELGVGLYSSTANKIIHYLNNQNFKGVDDTKNNNNNLAENNNNSSNNPQSNQQNNFRFVKNIYFSPASAFTLANFLDMYYQINNRPEILSLFNDLTDNSETIGKERLCKFLNTEQRDPRLNEILHPYKTESEVGLMIKKYNKMIGEMGMEVESDVLDKRGFYFFMLETRSEKI